MIKTIKTRYEMKKLIFLLAFAFPLLCMAQGGVRSMTDEITENDTLYADTIYWLNTTDVYYWSLQVNYSGVSAQDTATITILSSNDGGTTYSNYANMPVHTMVGTQTHQSFRDWWNEGNRLGIKIDVAVADTVYIDKVFYFLRKK